jgi:glycerophosphoryl diester phosphodiesterase
MKAYELAVEQRADMIEIDLHVSRDGAIPVAHDAELARIGGEGEIADWDLAAVQRLDAGDGERVPTLDEVLDGFSARIPFNLELKQGTRGPYPGLPAAALRAVQKRGIEAQTLFSSFYRPVLADLRRQSGEARIALLLSPKSPEAPIERAQALGAEAINPHFVMASPTLIDQAHQEGLAVYVFTVDDEEMMERLIDAGVDGLFTNRPERMRALLERRSG